MNGAGSIEILYNQKRTLDSGQDITVGLLRDSDLQYSPDNWENDISGIASFVEINDSIYLFPDFTLEPFLPAPPNPCRQTCDICEFITTTYSELPIFARLVSKYRRDNPELKYESKFISRDMKAGTMKFCEQCMENINDVVTNEFEKGDLPMEIVANQL